jgi:putative membrane protein
VKKFSDYVLLYSKGIAMGAADVIPGVSGGTVAFITGIYDELLASINKVNTDALKLLFRFRIKEFWAAINGKFLLTLIAGLVTSLLSLAKLMVFLLKTYPILIWSFFFGLILISAPLVLREIKHWTWQSLFGFASGIAVAYYITVVTPTESPTHLPFIFFSGAIAICAMILPGISGAFILLLIGKYQYMITALINFDIPVVLVFVSGCLVGILSFSRLLSWVLKHYHAVTIAVLAGFMLGSLNKVWPWREVLEYATNSKGEQIAVFDRSILPHRYFEVTGHDPLILQSILMMALGIFIVVLIERVATRLKMK